VVKNIVKEKGCKQGVSDDSDGSKRSLDAFGWVVEEPKKGKRRRNP
jgi:hypothetical protein